ncbi:hypothetical protein Tco_0811290 [Tanacetum coccineum]
MITLKSSSMVPLECASVFGPEGNLLSTKQTVKERVKEEVRKLVEAGIMKGVHYHDWLSNPVMEKKHDDSWRMCVDFKDLNKACPKDGYPLLEIDWKMPFGLRNDGATYQRLVDKAFHKQIGRNLEVPRVSVKGPILADFIVEQPEEDSPDTLMKAEEELPEP